MLNKRYIVVADSSRARFFRSGGIAQPWEELTGLEHLEARARNLELMADRPGRAFDSVGGGRHAMVERSDPQQHEAELFAREIAHHLAQEQPDCEQLAVIAPPRFLGLLRKHLDPTWRTRVAVEVAKNLVTQDPEDIRRHLHHW